MPRDRYHGNYAWHEKRDAVMAGFPDEWEYDEDESFPYCAMSNFTTEEAQRIQDIIDSGPSEKLKQIRAKREES